VKGKILLHSREIIDPLKQNGPYFKAVFQIIEAGDRVCGRAWIRGFPALAVTEEQKIDEPPIAIAKSMKHWLEVALEKAVKEYDESWDS
jgi:hypothetical protein